MKWGGKDCAYGIKWDPEQPEDAWYVCEATGCLIRYSEALEAQYKARWICEKTGIWTRDGFDFFDVEGRRFLPQSPSASTFGQPIASS